MTNDLYEIAATYAAFLASHVFAFASLGALGAALFAAWKAHRPRQAAGVALGVAVAVGAGFAWSQRSCVDDAFVTFRYVRHFLDGRGACWNDGECVQGYTNFLWGALVALGTAATPLDPPQVALVLGPLAWLANVATVAAIGRRLHGPGHLPIAALLLSVQYLATAFATTGLETGFASLLVDLGALALVSRTDPRGRALAGAALVAATLTRPDHGLFFLVGAGVVAVRREGWKNLAAFFAPSVAWIAWAGWAARTYGDVVPNTFYAKAGDGCYVSQGLVWLALFAAGTHLAVVGPIGLLWLRRDVPRAEADLRRFAVASGVLLTAWVVKIGGDFMFGRFLASLLPFVLLAAERAVLGSSGWRSVALAGALAMSARGTSLLEPGRVRWEIADESTVYPLTSFAPVVVRHGAFAEGQALGRTLAARGLTPVIATGGIGMIGYYSDLPLIDMHGLTDRRVAARPVVSHGRPGHEKFPAAAYLGARNTRLWASPPPDPWRRLTAVRLDGCPHQTWYIYRYDGALMRQIVRLAPEVHFVEMKPWLAHYASGLAGRSPAEARSDLAFLDWYYFELNGDPDGYRAAIARRAAADSGPEVAEAAAD